MTTNLRIGNAPLYAVGVYTSDVRKTANHYEQILGVVPQDFGTPTPTTPDGSQVTLKMNVVFFPNFYVKLQQPVSTNGPYAEGLSRYGLSIQNIQLHVDGTVDDIQTIRRTMVQDGGAWILGVDTDFRAYVDFREKLGTTLEPITVRPRGEVTPAPGSRLPALGTSRVTHVGFAVTNARETAQAFGDVFGIPIPQVRELRDLEYPPGTQWDEAARLRVARWTQGEIDIELIEPVGGANPWSEFVKARKGNAACIIGFAVGNRMDQTVRDLREKGGKWIYGKPGGKIACLDFRDTLGFVIQLTAS